jgi:hypothetical protein
MNHPEKDPHGRPNNALYIRIRLTCGCWTKSRNQPFRASKFGCDSGLRHGYSLRWTEFTTLAGTRVERKDME